MGLWQDGADWLEEPTILVLLLAEAFMSMVYNLKQVCGALGVQLRHGVVLASSQGANVNALLATLCREVQAVPRKGRRHLRAL